MARVGRIARTSLVVLAALAALAACGDDDDADAEADAELVEAALLSLDDLPDGFEEVEAEDDDDETANSVCNDEVLGLTDDEVDAAEAAEAGPVQFDADEVRVRAEVTAFEDDEVPRRIIGGIAEDEYLECLSGAIADQLTDEVTLSSVDITDAPLEGVDADDAGAIVVHFESAGTPVVSQVHAARVGRIGVSLEVTALEGELDEDLVADALAAMVERLRDG
jgi:hypothetical protein